MSKEQLSDVKNPNITPCVFLALCVILLFGRAHAWSPFCKVKICEKVSKKQSVEKHFLPIHKYTHKANYYKIEVLLVYISKALICIMRVDDSTTRARR